MTNCCWSMKEQLMCSEVRNVLGVSYIPEFPCGIRQKLDVCLPFYPSMFYFSTFWSVSSENISLINYLHADLISGSTLCWSKLSNSEKKMRDFDWNCAQCIDQIQENWQNHNIESSNPGTWYVLQFGQLSFDFSQ